MKKDPNSDQKIFFYEIEEMKKNVKLFNNDITEKEFKLRIFVESDIFNNCKTRESFKKTTNDLMQNINNFLTAFSLPKIDKSNDLQESFKEIEKSLRNTVKEGKQFCDEIYHMED